MTKIKSKFKLNSRILSIILKQIQSRPSLESIGVKQYRALLEKSAAMFKIDKTVICEDIRIDSIQGAWLTPNDLTGNRIILYLHGGGFIAGSINSHRDLATRIAKASNAKLLIINYRLAPEHKFPAGLNDAFDTYKWLINKKNLPENIIVAGDSAGGGLALSLLLLIKQKGLAIPGCAVFLSPWVDLECRGKSHLKNKNKDPMLTHDMLYSTIKLYTGTDTDAKIGTDTDAKIDTDTDAKIDTDTDIDKNNRSLSAPLISPINGDLTGLCPMLIQAGSCEILEDDTVMLAEKARHSGVKAELEIWEGMFHVWQYFARYLSQGDEAIEKIGIFIKNHC